MKFTKVLIRKTIFLGTLATTIFIAPAYCQQETMPTWYDPWQSESKAVPHKPETKAVERKAAPRSNELSRARQRPKDDMRRQARKQVPPEVKATEEIAQK
jgi:hypothetical protein